MPIFKKQSLQSPTVTVVSDAGVSLDPTEEYEQLRVKGVGIHTSEGENFNNTIFGRDSAVSARELLQQHPDLAHDVILTLARLQGVRYRRLSDEEPGRIHHEDRDFSAWHATLGKKIPLLAASVLWGGTLKHMTTYQSIDSTPLFVILVAEYVAIDPSILEKKVMRHDRKMVTIRQSMIEAAGWVSRHVTDEGLVVIPKHNVFGLTHQTWKDSPNAYIHRDGSMLRVLKPIAYLEMQCLSVDALRHAAAVIGDEDQEAASIWKLQADAVVKATIDRFWMQDVQFFASAIDRTKQGIERVCHVIQSDPGWMLTTSFFDGLAESDRRRYITGIVRQMMSPHFITDVGIRTRSLQYAKLLEIIDYHGVYTSWPIDTYMFSKGLRRQGLPGLAHQLETRVLNAVTLADDSYEFFYVLEDGSAVISPLAARVKKQGARALPTHMYPDEVIAWSVALVMRLEYGRARDQYRAVVEPKTWQADLEAEVLPTITDISQIKTHDELQEQYRAQPLVFLDNKRGNRLLRNIVVGVYLDR